MCFCETLLHAKLKKIQTKNAIYSKLMESPFDTFFSKIVFFFVSLYLKKKKDKMIVPSRLFDKNVESISYQLICNLIFLLTYYLWRYRPEKTNYYMGLYFIAKIRFIWSNNYLFSIFFYLCIHFHGKKWSLGFNENGCFLPFSNKSQSW